MNEINPMKNNENPETPNQEATPTPGGTTQPTISDAAIKTTESPQLRGRISAIWEHPAVVAPSNFIFKSLCEWVVNTCIGCCHGCLFCSVPSTSTIKQKPRLLPLGVKDPDAEWGQYVFPHAWDENTFMASLRSAEKMALNKLKPDGHRCVMFSSTTDPYQTIKNPDPKEALRLNNHHRAMVRRALELIRDKSSLNVRILTRSPLAKKDFELMKSFGNRLMFGMSLPTLNDTLARVFEPHAPSVLKRLETLQAAKEAGLNLYVAVAPTYPGCDEADIRATLEAVAELDPLTVFFEPINVRAENVERIRKHAEEIGVAVNLAPFETTDAWRAYSVEQLHQAERIAGETGLAHCLHLWPDKDLPSKAYLQSLDDPTGFVHWLTGWWTRVSEWPV